MGRGRGTNYDVDLSIVSYGKRASFTIKCDRIVIRRTGYIGIKVRTFIRRLQSYFRGHLAEGVT